MSYCRFSSDNWKCAVYCYYSTGDFYATYVAGNRLVIDLPRLPDLDHPRFLDIHREQMALMENAKREPIGLSRDGQSFSDPDLKSFRARLESLRDEGYNVPAFVFEDIEEDIETELKDEEVKG